MGNMAIKYLGLFHILLSHLKSYILFCFLQNVKSDDEGTYYCLAENKDGKNTYKVNLVVKGEETNDKKIPQQESNPVGCVPPAFLIRGQGPGQRTPPIGHPQTQIETPDLGRDHPDPDKDPLLDPDGGPPDLVGNPPQTRMQTPYEQND